jgi:hypothetical protein
VETGYLIHLKSNDLRLFAKVIVWGAVYRK